MEILSERLKRTRESKGITQIEIAEKLGINRVTYTGYENGKHQPSLDILIKIADYFQTSTDYLLGRYKE